MSAEENMALVRRGYEEGLNQGNVAVIDELVTPTDFAGRIKKGITSIRTAFPDWHLTIEDLLADDDRVVVRWNAKGTHRGEYRGIAPTGRQVTNNGITIWRIAEGKIVERWASGDGLGLLQQLGAITAPGQR
jgi:predicted ester cyclase